MDVLSYNRITKRQLCNWLTPFPPTNGGNLTLVTSFDVFLPHQWDTNLPKSWCADRLQSTFHKSKVVLPIFRNAVERFVDTAAILIFVVLKDIIGFSGSKLWCICPPAKRPPYLQNGVLLVLNAKSCHYYDLTTWGPHRFACEAHSKFTGGWSRTSLGRM